MVFLKVLSVIALIGSTGWLIADPDWEPALAVVGATATLVSVFVVDKQRPKPPHQQRQTVSTGSTGIQAGGDVNIGDLGGKKDA